jgi:hypothetical protein
MHDRLIACLQRVLKDAGVLVCAIAIEVRGMRGTTNKTGPGDIVILD